jgi:hypothetical protein
MPCCALIQQKATLVFTAFVTLSYWSLTVIMTIVKADVPAACLLGGYLRVQAFQGRVVCKVCGHVRITDSQPCITNMNLLPLCFAPVSCKGAQHLAKCQCSGHCANCSMLNAQCSMLNAQCSMLNAQCSMLNAQCSMLNDQCSMRNAQC